MSKSAAMPAFDYLSQPGTCVVGAACAVFGDDAFLKREVLHRLRHELLGEGDGEFSLTVFSGDESEWRDVVDALRSVSLFGSDLQLVIVEGADRFVADHRAQLEDYVARPSAGSCLVVDVKTLPSNTRLAKGFAAHGLVIDCRVPGKGASLQSFKRSAKNWLQHLADSEYKVTLTPAAADEMFELLPLEPGLLAQEVARLALYVAQDRTISPQLVSQQVGGWRTRTTWEMVDAAADGNAAEALEQLARLLHAGEQPIGLLAQMSGVLRRFTTATQLVEQAEARQERVALSKALGQAGVPPFRLQHGERQLKQIGRRRAKQLSSWLLDADLALKGHNSSPPRAQIELERLIVRLASAASDRHTVR